MSLKESPRRGPHQMRSDDLRNRQRRQEKICCCVGQFKGKERAVIAIGTTLYSVLLTTTIPG